jgi:hypothetical protein
MNFQIETESADGPLARSLWLRLRHHLQRRAEHRGLPWFRSVWVVPRHRVHSHPVHREQQRSASLPVAGHHAQRST